MYKTKTTTSEIDSNLFFLSPLPVYRIHSVKIQPPVLHPHSPSSSLPLLSVSLSACVCVQTQHRAQRPAVTSDSFTLCPLSMLTREVLCLKGLCYASSPLCLTHTPTHRSLMISKCPQQHIYGSSKYAVALNINVLNSHHNAKE